MFKGKDKGKFKNVSCDILPLQPSSSREKRHAAFRKVSNIQRIEPPGTRFQDERIPGVLRFRVAEKPRRRRVRLSAKAAVRGIRGLPNKRFGENDIPNHCLANSL